LAIQGAWNGFEPASAPNSPDLPGLFLHP